MSKKEIALMAHLMRRAGFGATYDELEERVSKGYEATVEELLDPQANQIPKVDIFHLYRFHPMAEVPPNPSTAQMNLIFHMITSKRPLEEKMTLFWHMIFATGNSKVDSPPDMMLQIEMLRANCLGNYKNLLFEMSKNPAMLFWLDNNQNHKNAPNENWARELLELFSMGHGHYTEEDVKVAARAFTGWTMKPKLPRSPYMRGTWTFEYRPDDHDYDEKLFLGRRGHFNGGDVIQIIAEQPETAQFIARHLYNFFVADEVQVPSWLDILPKDPAAVDSIAQVFAESSYEMRPTLRYIFNSDFFKDERVWFSKVKNPAELVVGVSRLVKEYKTTKPSLVQTGIEPGYQGQELINPPSVEGWHTGKEWIDTGSLVRRINYAADKLGDASLPGVQAIIDRVASQKKLTPEDVVDNCLEFLGSVKIDQDTREQVIEYVKSGGPMGADLRGRILEVLQIIAATQEYQFA